MLALPSVSVQPFQRLGHAVEGSEEQDLVSLPGLRQLCLQRLSDARMNTDRGAASEQCLLKIARRRRTRCGERRHGPVIDPWQQYIKNAVQILVCQQTEHRQAAPGR